ncbi:MAG: nucleotidyl transferase AbiEii/AbiGii toxin family protein [Candidatus Sulfotelmatobacter sp.]
MRPSAHLGFVLYGGTAIALQLSHRSSVDFDFFTEQPLDRSRIYSAFPFLNASTQLQDQPDTLSFLVPSGPEQQNSVKVSFFGGIDHGRVGVPRLTDDEVLQVASLDDLMATKLKTVLQRIESKDYRDIIAMLKAGVSLSKGLASASRMYGSANFQPSECLKALVYFEGGDLNELSVLDKREIVQAECANYLRLKLSLSRWP